MKSYEIFDGELHISIGILIYYEADDSFVIELDRNLTEWEAPLLFMGLVRRGIYTVPREDSRLWVRERIIPPGRQNIGEILNRHNMETYEEIRFLEISHGRCSQDSMYLKKTDILPDYVLQQQERNLMDVTPLDESRLLCLFADHKAKTVSLADLSSEHSIRKVLENQALFESAMVSPGGYAVTFDNTIDIPSQLLYELGTEFPLSADDLRCFAKKNVLTTTESCAFLGCSRQNIAYLSGADLIKPLKKEEGVSLYLRGDLSKTRW